MIADPCSDRQCACLPARAFPPMRFDPRAEMSPAALFARVFLPFACGYYLSYLFRTVNAVIANELARDLALSGSALGLLTSAYFLAFAAFQLPLGILLDRYGPRRVNGSLLLVAAIGAATFAVADSVPGLALARGLIGLGVSACLMASMKAFVLWFPMSRLATLNGWLMAVGGVGAMSASAPVEAALAFLSWRALFAVLAALTLAAASVVLLVVPERPPGQKPAPLAKLARELGVVYADLPFWRVAIVCMTVQAGFMSVQGLWVAPWLRDVAGFDRSEMADTLFVLALAMTAGFASSGTIADLLARRGVAPLTLLKAGTGLAAAAFALIASGTVRGTIAVAPWLALNFFATSAALSYAIVSRRFPRELAGRVNTALNLLIFVAAFCIQWGIGAIMDLWPQSGGRYPVSAYRAAFGVIAALQIASWLAIMPMREPGPMRAATGA